MLLVFFLSVSVCVCVTMKKEKGVKWRGGGGRGCCILIYIFPALVLHIVPLQLRALNETSGSFSGKCAYRAMTGELQPHTENLQ